MTKPFKPDPSQVTRLNRRVAPALSFSDDEGLTVTKLAPERLNSRVRLFRETFATAEVKQSVLLASTFRSGSTYVAELLRQNGIVGLSLEKFNTIWKASAAPDKAFRNTIRDIATTAEDGLFAAKIMWPHHIDLARCLRLERGNDRCLAESFPAAKWIWVKRRDKVRQAISFWRAQKSGRWHVFDGSPEPTVDYDYDEIRECYRDMLTHDVCWEDFFAHTGIEPFMIEYESFDGELAARLRRLLRFLGAKPGKTISTEVRLKKQRDALTEEIYDRFMNDCHRYG